MFLASALILPIGISYATYGNSSAFTTGAPTAQPVANQTSTNQTMKMPPSTNQTSMPPAMNQTMTTTNSTSSTPVVAKSSMLSPLQQVKSGVAPKDVQCKSGFTLIFKAEDGSPACVDSTVATILAQRGW